MTPSVPQLRLPGTRRASALLEGAWRAAIHGRGLEPVELREFREGDDVRDIDWRATARRGDPVVRRAETRRQRPCTIVAEAGRGLDAAAASGEPKRDLAIEAAGLVGQLALATGDPVRVLRGEDGTARLPTARAEVHHLRRGLRRLIHPGGESAILPALLALNRARGPREIVVVIAGENPMPSDLPPLVTALARRHDLLWITLSEADLAAQLRAGRRSVDVHDGRAIPVLGGAGLLRAYERSESQRRAAHDRLMDSLRISAVRIGAGAEVLPGIQSLIERHAARARH